MKRLSTKNTELLLMVIASAVAYLLFIPQFGYFNDDWYLMYAAGAKDASVFWDIFSIDRPLRALVMIPAYTLFGGNPIGYNLTAFVFRFVGAISFFWALRMLWKGKKRLTFFVALLFLLYPGFLSQPNAIDYLCHIIALSTGMISVALTIKSTQVNNFFQKTTLLISSILLGWFYLSQIEWYIGLEFFRFGCLLVISFRSQTNTEHKIFLFIKSAVSLSVIPILFLIWRLFYFESERGATDVSLQTENMLGNPIGFAFSAFKSLINDIFDVLVRAWGLPLIQLSKGFSSIDWVVGFAIALITILCLWNMGKFGIIYNDNENEVENWKWEIVFLGIGTIIFGLLPVILVGRNVDFKSFSRYSLIASIGSVLLIPFFVNFISNLKLQNTIFIILTASAILTHYANGLVKARETEATRNFWWQISWRIPQITQGATLISHYSVTSEEDYFIWGPANLIYAPLSDNEKYIQPAIYAMILTDDAVQSVLAREPQKYSSRRSIRTYPNARNILVISQPSPLSCAQIIDLNQLEISSFEDEQVKTIAPYSEADQILFDENFRTPPQVPFGDEPSHNWCYYYEKASLSRQRGDWYEVRRLGDEAISLEYYAKDQIEWLPFVQGYALVDDIERLKQIASFMKSDLPAKEQACLSLKNISMPKSVSTKAQSLFCTK